ncbi:MAG: serine/threonine protein kinase [Lentisphaerales bacterium]|nr:serine/threonine protein kinase [Lentisphaerales bacterium]
MNPNKKGKKISKRLLSLLGIEFKAVKGSETTLMTDEDVISGKGLVLPDSLLKRYSIQRLLGFGGYGSVFLSRDIIIGRLVALKVLNTALKSHEVIYEHFIQEARIAGQLDHENIVIIYNVEEHSNCACIVMEYLAEGNLALRIQEQGLFPEKDAVKIIKGILDGLSVAHRMKVIHRDIKPENILFDPKGRPKISDFGIAHLPKSEGGVAGPGEYNPVGTPSYMAPEQLKGSKKIDNRADLYSTGAILYEMLTGQRVYKIPKGLSFEETINIVKGKDYTPIRELNPEVSKELEQIVTKMLAFERDDRFSSANEVLGELSQLSVLRDEEEEKGDYQDMLFTSSEALLEDVMRLLLVDGAMSPAERREVNKRAERLKVSPERARAMENKIRSEMSLTSLEILEEYQATVTVMAGDGHLSDKEKEYLKKASDRLGIQDVERQMIENDAIEQYKKGMNNEDS